jgi:hypothetical protein
MYPISILSRRRRPPAATRPVLAAGAWYLEQVTFPRVLLLVLALLQAAGVVEVMRRSTCEQECKRDGCENDCTPGEDPPSCPCHCPSAPTATPPATAVAIVAPATQSERVTFRTIDQPRPGPDPREILHVPRSRAR